MKPSPYEIILFSAVVGLVGKIVWDFLSNRKETKMESHSCSDHSACIDRIEKCEKCINEIRLEHRSFESLLMERTANIILLIEKLEAGFTAQSIAISGINASIASLTAVIENLMDKKS